MTEPATLRDALIHAGIALLAEGGRTGLTLRRAAARAGVSHAAPAHHFDGLPGLLTAIAARAFQTFADTLHAAREAAGQDPRARLEGTCHGYLTFAATHAGLFHLMFVSPEVDRSNPDLTPYATRSYLVLREACAPFARSTPDEALEAAVWSLVHGYATLGFGSPDSDSRAPGSPGSGSRAPGSAAPGSAAPDSPSCAGPAPHHVPFARRPAFADLLTELLAGRQIATNPLAPTCDTR